MIELNKITVAREGKVVIHDCSAKFESGTVSAIIGPNGSGKSTLLLAISGDLPITDGEIKLNGLKLESYKLSELASLRSVVLQQPTFKLGFTVREILEMARFAGSTRESEIAAITELSIAEIADRKVTELSGGERDRVAIALALSVGAQVLLLDEPFAAQDSESRERIINLLQREAKNGKTIILVAHLPESELLWCDQIIQDY